MSISPDILLIEALVDMPLMKLPARSVAVRVSGGVALFSPGPNADLARCTELGSVTDIVAPTMFHDLGVQRAVETFPTAKIWGVPGFAEKLPDIKWSAEVTAANWPYQKELSAVLLKGMPQINETVFIHRKSKTLIVSDLCFNIADVRGAGAWIILHLFGTYRRFAISRLFRRFIADKAAFQRSLGELFSYDFDNIIMSHGDVVVGGGRERLLAVLRDRGLSPQ